MPKSSDGSILGPLPGCQQLNKLIVSDLPRKVDRRETIWRLDQRISPSREQLLNDVHVVGHTFPATTFLVGGRNSQVQSHCTPVVALVHVCSPGSKEFDNVRMAPIRRHMKRRVAGRERQPGTLYDLTSAPALILKGGEPLEFSFDGTCVVRRHVQVNPMAPGLNIGVRPTNEEQRHYIRMAPKCGPVQRRLAPAPSGVHGSPMIQESFRHFGMPDVCGNLQRRLLEATCGVKLRTLRQQVLDGVRTAAADRGKEH